MFHRYFKPIARKTCSEIRPIEIMSMDEPTFLHKFSSSASSAALTCGGIIMKKLTVSLS